MVVIVAGNINFRLHWRTFSFTFVLLICLIFSSSSEARISMTATDSSSTFLRKGVESTMSRYLREIGETSSFVHLLANKVGQEERSVSRATISATCAKSRVAVVLLEDRIKSDDSQNERQSAAGSPAFRYVVGIFTSINRVQPDKWKRMYSDEWNPRARFAIFIESPVDVYTAKKLLASFWSVDCAYVVLVTLQDSIEDSDTPRIYSYDPFRTNDSVFRLASNDPLFPEKLNNLQGRPIRVSFYSHWPIARLRTETGFVGGNGTDVELIRYLAQKLNFTVSLGTSSVDAASYIVHLPSGNRLGPIGDIVSERSEILGNSQFLEDVLGNNGSLDFVYPHWRSESVVVVKRAPALPAIVNSFGRGVHASLITCAMIIAISIFFIYLRLARRKNKLLTIFGLLLFQRLPNIGNGTSERIFCIAWIYWAFLVTVIYQGQLVHELTSPPIYRNVDTLKELAGWRTLRLIVKPYERVILDRSIGDSEKVMLARRATVELNFSACVRQLVDSTNVACSIDGIFGRYVLGQVRRYELLRQQHPGFRVSGIARVFLKPPIHILREHLIDFWKTYVVRRGFPYLDNINVAVTRAVEFGLVDKWLRDDVHSIFEEPQTTEDPRALSLLHMDYMFAFLIFGHVVASVTFVFEILYYKRE